jgi:hypothetical protein
MLAEEFRPMKTAGFVAAGLLVAVSAFAQTDISGDWDLTVQSTQGTKNVRVTFKQDGDSVSGIFKSPMGELPFRDGTLTGNDLKFAFSIPIQGQPIDITMTGTVDGSTITGKAQFGALGEGDWTAKRVEAVATDALEPSSASNGAAVAVGTGINGHWDVTVKTQMGDVPVAADLTESAGKVSGSIVAPTGSVDVTGTLDGNALKLSFTAKTPQGDIPVELTGELTGDSIVNGKAEIVGIGQGEWTARRRP